MKVIIEIAKSGSALRHARQQLIESQQGIAPNFRLSFESAQSLFIQLTPARLDLLDTLSRVGPCNVHTLQLAIRNNANVRSDVAQLEELGLIERSADNTIAVPFDSVEILMPLTKAENEKDRILSSIG